MYLKKEGRLVSGNLHNNRMAVILFVEFVLGW